MELDCTLSETWYEQYRGSNDAVVEAIAYKFCEYLTNIIRCTTECFPSLVNICNLRCQTKITDFNSHLWIQKKITQLQISMNNQITVQVLQRAN